MALDVTLFYFFNNLAGGSRVFDALVVFFADYFQYFVILAFLLLLYFSAYTKRERLRIFWVAVISSAVARLGATELIRFFYHRPRPFAALTVHQLISDKEWAFPSGHAAFFFALSAAVYFYNKKWGIGFFIASILITFARVIAGAHWPSDIAGGAIIGIAIAYIIFYFYEKYL